MGGGGLMRRQQHGGRTCHSPPILSSLVKSSPRPSLDGLLEVLVQLLCPYRIAIFATLFII